MTYAKIGELQNFRTALCPASPAGIWAVVLEKATLGLPRLPRAIVSAPAVGPLPSRAGAVLAPCC